MSSIRHLERFPKRMWRFKPSPKDWSIHEIIIHITDSEANSYVRCRRFVAEPGETLMAYDENGWAERLSYLEQDFEQAVALFKLLRASSYHLIKDLPEAVLVPFGLPSRKRRDDPRQAGWISMSGTYGTTSSRWM